MKIGRLAPALTLVGMFLLGGIAGAGIAVAYVHREAGEFSSPRFRERARLRGLSRLLDLNDAQREQVRGILEKYKGRREAAFSDMMGKCGDSVRSQKLLMDAEIRAVLLPEQQQRFDTLVRRQDAAFLSGAPGAR